MQEAKADIRDVKVTDSSISSIDPVQGVLRYRGYPIEDLATHCTFEEVATLLWYGELPSTSELGHLGRRLDEERVRAWDLLQLLPSIPTSAHPLDVLRYLVSFDALRHPLVTDNSEEANLLKSLQFLAWFPVAVASLQRIREGKRFSTSPPAGGSARALLGALYTDAVDEVAVRALDRSFVLHADHELNASTFAARVTIATQSNLHAAVASALGTLSGPRHGGASDRVIRMIETIGRPERARDYVHSALARRERVMGFGHPVYRTLDPRARLLREMALELNRGTGRSHWVAILDEVAAVMAEERSLYPNVDLYAALVNHALGVDPDFYSAVFACSRIVGWTAHAIEALDGRIIRPSARYVGPDERRIPAATHAH